MCRFVAATPTSRVGALVACMLVAAGALAPCLGRAFVPSPTLRTADSTCAEAGPSRTVGPVRVARGGTAPVNVRGLHVRLGGVNLSERPCYTVTGLELGWIGAARRLDGVALGLGNAAHTMRGVDVNLASLGTTRSGVFVTGLFAVEGRAAGVSVALFKNTVYRAYGVFAGGWNDADRTVGGMVGAANGSNDTYGLQAGLLNSSLRTRGVQIGLYNRSESLRGLQLGLLNTVTGRDGPFQRLPLLNVGW